MRLLALDTSGVAVSAAVAQGDRIVAACHEPLAHGHAERTLPLLRDVICRAGWAWRDIEVMVVSLGPGNFTGLRAGVAVARALSLAIGCPTLGLGTMESAAEAAAEFANDQPIQVVLDARRGEVHAQRFAADLQALTEPALLSLGQLLDDMPAGCLLVSDLGDGRRELSMCDNRTIEAKLDARYLLRAAWRRLASGDTTVPGTALRPLYLRSPDARPGAGASLLAAQV